MKIIPKALVGLFLFDLVGQQADVEGYQTTSRNTCRNDEVQRRFKKEDPIERERTRHEKWDISLFGAVSHVAVEQCPNETDAIVDRMPRE